MSDLTRRQTEVLLAVEHYTEAIGEPAPAAWVARVLGIERQVVCRHYEALHERGRLRGPSSPAVLTRRVT